MRTKLRPLEFQVFRQLREALPSPSAGRIWLALSGGFDSWALLNVMTAVAPRLELELGVLHVHHGASDQPAQRKFRDEALLRVEEWSQIKQLPIQVVRAEAKDQSEAALRRLRREAYRKIDGWVATGHHADDLFETRLIRLLRGTGSQGLRSMSLTDGRVLRPLLGCSRSELVDSVEAIGGASEKPWLEDPSNLDPCYLRTRVRRELIPTLNRVREGGARSMARSLELLAAARESAETPDSEGGLDRAEVKAMTVGEQRQVIASLLRSKGVTNYSRNQIDEVLKRLDSNRKRLTFEIATGQKWEVDTKIHLDVGSGIGGKV